MLKQDAITPLYVQLMEELETSIRNGVYKPGDKIMTGRGLFDGKGAGGAQAGKRNVCHKAEIFKKHEKAPELYGNV